MEIYLSPGVDQSAVTRRSFDTSAIIPHLDRITGSATFKKAPRMQKFLRYIVIETLSGRADELKEYSIGVAVFDRPADFAPNVNPIVRVEAARLRRCLADFYEHDAGGDNVVITVPKGTYVPEISVGHKHAGAIVSSAPTITLSNADNVISLGSELREVTVLSCTVDVSNNDINDPEAYLDIFRSFTNSVHRIAARYVGAIDAHSSDRIIVYFGWPTAMEGDAHRAVASGLDIATLGRLDPLKCFGVRVGIATGQVVIENAARSGAPVVVGHAAAFASRIMRHAALNEVVLTDVTRNRVGDAFDMSETTAIIDPLRGSIKLWKTENATANPYRFSATATGNVPIIGRRQELAFLLRRWRDVLGCRGKATIVVGEAGIGKSKLIQALADKTRSMSPTFVFQCYAHYADSPLHPVTGWARENLDLIREHVGDEDMDLITRYLNNRFPLSDPPLSPARIRDTVFDAFIEIFVRFSRLRPTTLVFEDVQWSDPTTTEFLKRLSATCSTERILLIISSRSIEIARSLPEGMILSLTGLTDHESLMMVERISPHLLVQQDTCNAIVERAEGIPIYIEELAKSYVNLPDGTALPFGLINLLTAQIDKLGSGRSMAQVAAVIGRKFDGNVLCEAMSLSPAQVDQGIQHLIAHDVIVERGHGRSRHLAFRHALLRDAAYSSMTVAARQRWHARIAETLEANFHQLIAEQPSVVARHWQDANIPQKAIPLLLVAGCKEAKRFANTEALGHFRNGLRLLRDVPATGERQRLEIRFLTEIALLLRVSYGYGHSELWSIYYAASALCTKLGDSQAYGENVFGLWTFAASHADWKTANQLSESFASLVSSINDNKTLQVESWRLQGTSALYQGRVTDAYELLRKAVGSYNPDGSLPKHGYDSGATSLAYLSWATLFLGERNEVMDCIRKAQIMAEAKGHSPTTALVMGWTMLPLASLENFDEILKNNSKLEAICDENGLLHWRAFGDACAAWARFRLTGQSCFIPQILAAAERFESLWGQFLKPFFWLLAADAHQRNGQHQQGLELVNLALDFQKAHGELLLESQAHHMAAVLHASAQPPNTSLAKYHLRRSTVLSKARKAGFQQGTHERMAP